MLLNRPEPLVLSVTEAAVVLGISRTLAYELVARRELPSLRLGGRVVVPRQALERLLDVERATVPALSPAADGPACSQPGEAQAAVGPPPTRRQAARRQPADPASEAGRSAPLYPLPTLFEPSDADPTAPSLLHPNDSSDSSTQPPSPNSSATLPNHPDSTDALAPEVPAGLLDAAGGEVSQC